jgi:hypothetical protein
MSSYKNTAAAAILGAGAMIADIGADLIIGAGKGVMSSVSVPCGLIGGGFALAIENPAGGAIMTIGGGLLLMVELSVGSPVVIGCGIGGAVLEFGKGIFNNVRALHKASENNKNNNNISNESNLTKKRTVEQAVEKDKNNNLFTDAKHATTQHATKNSNNIQNNKKKSILCKWF